MLQPLPPRRANVPVSTVLSSSVTEELSGTAVLDLRSCRARSRSKRAIRSA
jgi:hypothetical protein